MLARALWFVGLLALALPLQAATITYSLTFGPEVSGATGSGTGTLVYDDVAHTLSIDVNWTGLSGTTTVAHVHCCTTTAGTGTVGVAVTPNTLPGFPTGVTSGAYQFVVDLTQSGSYTSSFVTGFGGGTIAGAEAALVAGMNAEKAYFNIHTNLFPGGEIRDFTSVPEPPLGALALGALALAAAASRRRAQT